MSAAHKTVNASGVDMNADDSDHEIDSGEYEHKEADEFHMNGHYSENWRDSDNSIVQFVDETDPYTDENTFDEQKACRAIAKFFCSAAIPPRTVEQFCFMGLRQLFNPQFHVSSDSVGRCCLEIYEEEKEKIKQLLRDLDGQICLSVDVLRNEKRYDYGQEYLCLKVHFIDDNWKLKKWILKFSLLWDHLEDLPSDVIIKSLEDWEIVNKISTITLVNSDFSDEIFEIVKEHIQKKKELQLNGRLFQVSCCGDIVSLMVQGAYKEIPDIIDKVFELYPLKSLPLWYLINSNLKGALEMQATGEFSSQSVLDYYDVPSADEWEKVRSICKLVDSIYEVANALFEAKRSTANIYFHHLQEIREILIQEASGSDCFITRVAKKMLEKFDKYWKNMYLVLAIAMVMDPRFKMKYIEFFSSKFDGSDGSSGTIIVLEVIRGLYNDYLIRFPEKENFFSDPTSSDSEEESSDDSPRNSSNGHFKLLLEYNQFIESSNIPRKSDLDWYLEEPVLSWNEEFEVLSWWRTASSKYPILSRMARDFLAVPISIATSFDAFYTEPREAEKRITSSGPDIMNALMCTKSWYPWPENS